MTNFFSIIKGELDILVSSNAFQTLEANDKALVLQFLHQLVLAILAVLAKPVASCWPWSTTSGQSFSLSSPITGVVHTPGNPSVS